MGGRWVEGQRGGGRNLALGKTCSAIFRPTPDLKDGTVDSCEFSQSDGLAKQYGVIKAGKMVPTSAESSGAV